MITAAELAPIPLFAVLDESARHRLAQKAADIRVEGGDWVIREGEDPRFFVVLEGLLQVVKDIVGQRRELEQLKAGEFFGEIPILLGTANIVSVLAVSRSRLARFDRQQLQELIRDSSSSGTTIFQTMTDRLSMAPQYVKETPTSRVLLVGSPYDAHCRAIRSFLSANQVQYDWLDSELEPERASSCRSTSERRNRSGRRWCDSPGDSDCPQRSQRRWVSRPRRGTSTMTLSSPVPGRQAWRLESMEPRKG